MILLKTISREYFKKNIAFYLFIILFAFGFLSGNEHVAFAKLFMGKANLLLWAALFWFLHVIKTSLFFHRTLKLPEYAFLQDFTLFPKGKQLLELLILQLNLNSPFIAYSAFMVLIGFQTDKIAGIAFVMVANLLLLVLPILFNVFRLNNFDFDFSIKAFGASHRFLPNWPSLYFIRYLVLKQPILYFSTKLYALFFIVGGAQLYFTDDYDERLLYICCLFSAAGQFPIAKEFGAFSANNLMFERNFPLSISKVFIQRFLAALSIASVDMVFLGYHWYDKISIWYLLSGLIFILSSMLFWLSYNYSPKAFSDAHLKRIYFAAFSIFILIMFKVPFICFASIFSLLSWWLIKSNYFTFEFTPIETS